MKKTLKFVTRVFLLLLPCALIFSGCSEMEGAIQPHEHSFGEWTVTSASTCSVAGQEQRACACGVTETQSMQKLAHTYSKKAHVCTECQASMTQIASVNDFMAYDGATDAVIFLDKCFDSSGSSEKKTVVLGPVTDCVRLIGTPGKVYDLSITAELSRQRDVMVELVDATLKTSQDTPVIQSNSTNQLSVCFYGSECGLVGKKGADGTNAGILSNFSMNGDDGSRGQFAIEAAGAVRLVVAADQVEIRGGNGGSGGSGMNAAPAPQSGGDGGNGGDGAYAINASSIDVYVADRYPKEAIAIKGGNGGSGGHGGSKFLIGKDGSDGKEGVWATPTNVEPTYGELEEKPEEMFQAEWDAKLADKMFENYTYSMEGRMTVTQDGEPETTSDMRQIVKVTSDKVSTTVYADSVEEPGGSGGFTQVYEGEIAEATKTQNAQLFLTILRDYENFEYDAETNTYKIPETVVFEEVLKAVSGDGMFDVPARIEVREAVVTFSEDGRIATLVSDYTQAMDFGGSMVTTAGVTTWTFTDFGTTVIY